MMIGHWHIDWTLVTVLAIVVCCFLVEGFFSGSEIAMVSCDRARLRRRSREGHHGAKMAERLLGRPARLFSITLFGINLSAIVASTVTTFYLIDRFGPAYGSLAILLSPFILIFAEILPKSIYHHNADRMVDRVAPLLTMFGTIFSPVILGLQRLTDRLLGGVRRASGSERRITREELVSILHGEETRGTDIRPTERKIVSRVLRLVEMTAKNVMIPLIEIEALPNTATCEAAFELLQLKGYPRIPIFSGRIFNVVGIIEATDILGGDPSQKVQDVMHPAVFVPKGMRLNEVFRLLRSRREEVAVVVDEYGSTLGLVGLEEIFEEVVGDIRDEYEFDEPQFRKIALHHFYVTGRLDVKEAREQLGLDIPPGDYQTMAGFLLQRFGYIPQIGEQITIGSWVYRIRQATSRAILEVEIWFKPEE